MLPISKHRTLVIPHRFALAAAGVCLALSFTVDQATVDDKLQAEGNAPVEQLEELAPASAGTATVSPTDQPGDVGPAGRGKVSLLPWFSGLTN